MDCRREKKDGRYPIKLYVYYEGSRFLFTTPYSSAPGNWDGSGYNRNEPNYRAKNIRLSEIRNKAEMVLLQIDRMDGGKPRAESVKAMINEQAFGIVVPKADILAGLFERFASRKSGMTQELYGMTYRKVTEFDPEADISKISKEWLESFDAWMEEAGLKTNTRSIHLRNLRAVMNYAIDEEVTTNYPFRKFKIKSEPTRKRSLTKEQLATLRDYGCEEHQKRYRDIFMLMFYLIGVNAKDLLHAKPSDVYNGRLEYKRAKTGKLYSILIQPEAAEIIRRYKGKGYLLNIMDEYGSYKDFLHRMNDSLRKIGCVERKGRGGKKIITPLFPDLSSYWARHTWATIAASLDIPKETISAALGHEIGSAVTSIYIDFDQKKVDEANRAVLDYIKCT